MKYITLTTEELDTLERLYKKSTDPLVKKCSHSLLLSHQKRTIADLMKIFNVSRRTIERWFDGWKQRGIDSLQMVSGRGGKPKLKGYEEEVEKHVGIHGQNL